MSLDTIKDKVLSVRPAMVFKIKELVPKDWTGQIRFVFRFKNEEFKENTFHEKMVYEGVICILEDLRADKALSVPIGPGYSYRFNISPENMRVICELEATGIDIYSTNFLLIVDCFKKGKNHMTPGLIVEENPDNRRYRTTEPVKRKVEAEVVPLQPKVKSVNSEDDLMPPVNKIVESAKGSVMDKWTKEKAENYCNKLINELKSVQKKENKKYANPRAFLTVNIESHSKTESPTLRRGLDKVFSWIESQLPEEEPIVMSTSRRDTKLDDDPELTEKDLDEMFKE